MFSSLSVIFFNIYILKQVCLGSENNTKTSIYKNHIIRITVNTPQILNGDKTRGFWINWCGGFIGVGKRGEQNPFISWLDKDSLNVSFYGVRTRDNATGVWTIKGLFVYQITSSSLFSIIKYFIISYI